MFRRADRTTTERRQLLDSTTEDEQIETKIKECQRENVVAWYQHQEDYEYSMEMRK
jgi:hypothetical protein